MSTASCVLCPVSCVLIYLFHYPDLVEPCNSLSGHFKDEVGSEYCRCICRNCNKCYKSFPRVLRNKSCSSEFPERYFCILWRLLTPMCNRNSPVFSYEQKLNLVFILNEVESEVWPNPWSIGCRIKSKISFLNLICLNETIIVKDKSELVLNIIIFDPKSFYSS